MELAQALAAERGRIRGVGSIELVSSTPIHLPRRQTCSPFGALRAWERCRPERAGSSSSKAVSASPRSGRTLPSCQEGQRYTAAHPYCKDLARSAVELPTKLPGSSQVLARNTT